MTLKMVFNQVYRFSLLLGGGGGGSQNLNDRRRKKHHLHRWHSVVNKAPRGGEGMGEGVSPPLRKFLQILA